MDKTDQPVAVVSSDQLGGFAEGAWVANFDTEDRPQIAQVKDAYRCGSELVLDLVLFSRSGDRTGRASPSCGGPRTFEPACSAALWALIAKPDFEYIAQARFGWGDRVRRMTPNDQSQAHAAGISPAAKG